MYGIFFRKLIYFELAKLSETEEKLMIYLQPLVEIHTISFSQSLINKKTPLTIQGYKSKSSSIRMVLREPDNDRWFG